MSPSSSPANSSTVLVSWNEPANPQGVIIRYVIYKYEPPAYSPAMMVREVDGMHRQAGITGLKAYTVYKFTVKACNSFDCTGHSPDTSTKTKPAGSYLVSSL